jgi:AI-2 transport protein TqsA
MQQYGYTEKAYDNYLLKRCGLLFVLNINCYQIQIMNTTNGKNSALTTTVLFLHGLILVLLLMYWAKIFLIPFFFSFLLAVFLYPMCKWLEQHKLNRLFSSFICILLLFLLAAIVFYFVGSQFQRFVKDIPILKDKLTVFINNSQAWVKEHYHVSDDIQPDYLNKSFDNVFNAIGFTVSSSFALLIFMTLTIFFTFYILLYRELLKNFILFPFNRGYKKKVTEISLTLNETIASYIKGLLIEMAILIILISITLWILGIKYAILMAFMAGILNIIPYIGIYTAASFGILITIADGTGQQSLEVLLVFAVIHIIDANLITPFIVGRRIKINPLATLIAVICGELVWGIPGMFLFIPLTAITKIVLEKMTSFESEKLAG